MSVWEHGVETVLSDQEVHGPATMRVRLIPLETGPATLGPFDVVSFSLTRASFDATTAHGSIWKPLDPRQHYCCLCKPIPSEREEQTRQTIHAHVTELIENLKRLTE